MSTNFLYAHAYCGISVRDIGTHVSKVCNASKRCAMSDLICVTSSRSFLSSFASSVAAVVVVLDGVLNLATTLYLLHGLQIPHFALLLLALSSF